MGTQIRVGIIGFIGTISIFGFLVAWRQLLHADYIRYVNHSTSPAPVVAVSQNAQLAMMQGMDDTVHQFDAAISTVNNQPFQLNKSIVSPTIYQEAQKLYASNRSAFVSHGVTLRLTSFQVVGHKFEGNSATNRIECIDAVGTFVGNQEVAEIDNDFEVTVIRHNGENTITSYRTLSSHVRSLT